MSPGGGRPVPPPGLERLFALRRGPPPGASHETLVDHYVRLFGVIGSPDQQTPEALLRARLHRSFARAFRPEGTARQMLAIVATGDRSGELALITAPTLVIHGTLDPLVPPAAGRDTARRIKGAELLMMPGMGHDLPLSRIPMLVDRIAAHCEAASRS